MMIPVKGFPNLYRDEKTGAILNLDNQSYNNYMKIKKNKEIEKNEIDQIKKDIEEIKLLLKEFLNGSR